MVSRSANGIWLEALRRLRRPGVEPGRSLLGRALLRRGETAAALWWGSQDRVVLSGLGMHLSADACQDPPVATDETQMLARLRTSVALGRRDEALRDAADLIARGARARAAAERLLVGLRDAQAVDMLTRGSPGRAAAWLALGEPQRALDEAQALAVGPPASNAIELLALRTSAWRQLGEHQNALLALEQLCRIQSLRPVRHESPGIAGLVCSSQPRAGGPLVTVIMPVRNVAAHLAAALGSVQRQDHHDLEIVIVDDCSDDGTPEIAEAAAARDARITVVRRRSQGGAYRARNDGLQRARGEMITFHDGDDWSHPEKVTAQLQALQVHPGAVACLSDWIRMLDDGSFTARQVYPLARMNMSSLMIRRALVLPQAGCFDPVLAGADSEYPARLRLLFGRDAIVRVRKVLSFASTRQDSLMHDVATGYGSESGRRQRLLYWEAWHRWHATIFGSSQRQALRLGPDGRPFEVPESWSEVAAPIRAAAAGATDALERR